MNALLETGVVARARRFRGRATTGREAAAGRSGRPPSAVRSSPDFGSSGTRCPAATSAQARSGDAEERRSQHGAGARLIGRCFSKGPREFYAAHAPEGVHVDDLLLARADLCSQLNSTPKAQPGRGAPRCAVSRATRRILELSTRAPRAQASRFAAEARVFLTGHGVDLGCEQRRRPYGDRVRLELEACRHIGGSTWVTVPDFALPASRGSKPFFCFGV